MAEELNVTRAAERLHTAQPSLSHQIRQLEGLVGAPLFLRDKHRLSLSHTGKVFLPAARDILDSVEKAFTQAQATAKDEVSTIVLGMIMGPEGIILSQLLPLLLRRSPEIHLRLRTMTAPEQIQALLKREIMAGFLRGPIEEEDLLSEVYSREEVVAVIPEAWDLARFDRVPITELAKRPLISISESIAPAVFRVTGEVEQRAGVRFNSSFCSESLMTSLNAVASGLGFCFFAKYVGEVVPKGAVTRSIDLDPAPTLDLLFAYRRDAQFPSLTSLIALVQEHSPFRKQQAGL